MPAHALLQFRLREALQEPNTFPVAVKAVDVVENDGSVLIAPELAVKTKRRGVALQPAGLAGHGSADDLALAQAVAAQKNQQVQIAAGKSRDNLFQIGVGASTRPQRGVGFFPTRLRVRTSPSGPVEVSLLRDFRV